MEYGSGVKRLLLADNGNNFKFHRDCKEAIGTTMSFALTIPNLDRAEASIDAGSLFIRAISTPSAAFARRILSTSVAMR